MFDKMETHVRGLKALGVATERYDKLLIPLLQPKLPDDIQVEISRKCGSGAWNLNYDSKAFLKDLQNIDFQSAISACSGAPNLMANNFKDFSYRSWTFMHIEEGEYKAETSTYTMALL